MGSSYETVLVAADVDVLCQFLEAVDQEAEADFWTVPDEE